MGVCLESALDAQCSFRRSKNSGAYLNASDVRTTGFLFAEFARIVWDIEKLCLAFESIKSSFKVQSKEHRMTGFRLRSGLNNSGAVRFGATFARLVHTVVLYRRVS